MSDCAHCDGEGKEEGERILAAAMAQDEKACRILGPPWKPLSRDQMEAALQMQKFTGHPVVTDDFYDGGLGSGDWIKRNREIDERARGYVA